MQWTRVWLMLHLYFSFSFVGSLIVAEWVGGIARRAPEWRDRALLYEVLKRSTQWVGLLPLVLLGALGNVVATQSGLRMAADPWLRTVNVAWLLMLIVLAAVGLPSIRRLAALSRAAATGGASAGYESALRNWRFANLALTLLYVAMLALMVSQAKL